MRASQTLVPTLKEIPADAEVISHQLMLRAGMIRKLASGLYSWLPIGLRVLRKVEQVIREEMDAIGAQEVLMPIVQPADLWQESGRWQEYGAELLRIKDRHDRDFCLGPTHEEVITDIIRNNLSSYKQLPQTFYQIQTKFRDEVRPRFGLMRGREFTMKDAYSFHTSTASLEKTYQTMFQAYTRIFTRIGLVFRAVEADTGSIGGNVSHEFHVLADSGEDSIAFSDSSEYAANIEKAEASSMTPIIQGEKKPLEKIHTPSTRSIEDLCQFLSVSPDATLKTLIVHGIGHNKNTPVLVALVLRCDHELNEIKAENLPEVETPLCFADEVAIKTVLGCASGFLGPQLPIKTYIDRSAAACNNFICGSNEEDYHLMGCNWSRDIPIGEITDLRNVVEGDLSPDGKGSLVIKRGIEVGHIFQLGTKYSDALNATVLDENGKAASLNMGCYGIGVSRIVAAAIEQSHDSNGIIWPESIAPFQIIILPLNMQKSEAVRSQAEALYTRLKSRDIDVYIDDRDERPGVKFADAELMGVPHCFVIGDKSLKANKVEYRHRSSGNRQDIDLSNLDSFSDTLVN